MLRKLIILQIAVFSFLAITPSVLAGDLQFDPTTSSIQTNQTVEVKINVDAGSDSITAVDAVISYDQNLLTVSQVKAGTFFPNVSENLQTAGKVYINGVVNTLDDAVTGSGLLATAVFQAKNPGSATLVFDCTNNSSQDSNIIKNDANATDVITCSANGTASITIAGIPQNVTPTLLPSPTSSIPIVTTYPQPTVLPRSGSFENILGVLAAGSGLTLIGLFFLSLL